MSESDKKIENQAKSLLEGKKIVKVRYLTDEEMDEFGWFKRPICFFLNDGTSVVVSSDDEGNEGGVLFCGEKGIPTLTYL